MRPRLPLTSAAAGSAALSPIPAASAGEGPAARGNARTHRMNGPRLKTLTSQGIFNPAANSPARGGSWPLPAALAGGQPSPDPERRRPGGIAVPGSAAHPREEAARQRGESTAAQHRPAAPAGAPPRSLTGRGPGRPLAAGREGGGGARRGPAAAPPLSSGMPGCLRARQEQQGAERRSGPLRVPEPPARSPARRSRLVPVRPRA